MVACTPGQRAEAKTVLSTLDIACIIAAPVEATVPEIATACNVAEELIPDVEKVLAAKRKGMGAKHAGGLK